MALFQAGHALSLAHLGVGRPGTILSVAGDSGLLQRLSALGICQGKTVSVLRRAWWSGPLHLRVGMTELMLRRRDAQRIRIQLCGHPAVVAESNRSAAGLPEPAPHESGTLQQPCQGAA
jgi:ferrous iron transport protein A